jgi:hypothetical protein
MPKLMTRHLLMLILVNICLLKVNGQGPWSISISNSPRIEHRDPRLKNLLYYPFSPSIITDYRMTDRFSFSTGVFFHYEKDKDHAIGIPSTYFIFKTYLYEVPIQSNYHFNDKTNKFDPFIKTAIRYTFYHLSSTMHVQEDIIKSHYNDSYVLWDFGAGLNFKIHENLFLRCQLSYGFGLIHEYKNFRYFEPLISLGYTFNK